MIRILVLEDDAKLNQAVCTYLNDRGFEAKGCLNANDAYDEMYNNLYDLIISDIMMPEIDGFEFAKTVRKVNKHIPILFMSAKDDLSSKQKGFLLGTDDYMVKPVVLEELLLRVRALLRRANIEMESNILKLNKLEKQTIVPEIQVYDVCAQLAECTLGFEQAWEQKELDFDADMEDRAEIAADPALMELVWNNLFSNAVKFTEPGGSITLTETSDEQNVYVSVRDTGCGMDENTKKHIFEKFYQGDTSHATAGNGLGLALVMRVLQLNHFDIQVESEAGKGSCFTVTMPKARGEHHADV